MRLSELFFTTLRDDPGEAEMPSHRLLLRAGYLRQLGSGIYSLLPLGKRVSDRGERDMVLAMTHEEVVALLLRDIVQSYRQLPMIVYHFQTKFRDEPRSRGGLIRVREFVMKDSYSLDLDTSGLDHAYELH